MRSKRLIIQGLTYYWRTHLAVVLGVATAVAVLAGALLVGDSVRGSLRDLVLDRLGRADHVVASAGFFREQLADDIRAEQAFNTIFNGIVPLVVVPGFVTEQESGRRAGRVSVYGVDDRFWRFHGLDDLTGPRDREAFLSPALAAQLDTEQGRTLLVRVQRPTDVPLESLHGRRDDLGRTIRLTVDRILPRSSLGEFSLEAQQGDVRAVFVPLSRLQTELEVRGRANTLLVSGDADAPAAASARLEQLVRDRATLEDLGLTIDALADQGVLAIGAEAGLLDEALARVALDAAAGTGMQPQPILTYLANSIRVDEREIPYSLVTAIDLKVIASAARLDFDPTEPRSNRPPIVLSDWAADELRADTGDLVELDYYVWEDPGRLVTRTSEFHVVGVVPLAAGDRHMAPVYPGISDSPTLDEWDPPFPIDLSRIRPADEEYWQRYRTTPKAFVPLAAGQQLWQSRYGALTSIRISPAAGQSLEAARTEYLARVHEAIDPLAGGLAVRDVRTESLGASRGATDFGEYFVYFSFFLVVSALLLSALFFKLGVEQRVREVGLLRAVGFGPGDVRRLFLGEGVLLSVAGSLLGILGALGYGAVMMYGLRTWWVDAVGTTALNLHVTAASLVAGAVGGVAAAVACIWWTLGSLSRVSERALLTGQIGQAGDAAWTLAEQNNHGQRLHGRGVRDVSMLQIATVALLGVGAGLVGLSLGGGMAPAGAFFGAGSALLGAALFGLLLLFRRAPGRVITGQGWHPVSQLGLRNATYRPGRSVLSIAVIAAATFILIAVDAFRRDEVTAGGGYQTGVGGYSLIVETLFPVVQDPNTREGRDALNLYDVGTGVTFEPFRLLPGDDASCLNLYEPRNPRILAPRDSFLEAGRFAFQASLASTDSERANPWLLLLREEPDGAIPVIADANSMRYVLHRRLGDDIVLDRSGGEIRLRLVAALRDSIFQGELLMAQEHFVRLFPEQEGYQVLLVDGPSEEPDRLAGEIADALADLGAEVVGTAERLAQFYQVENTYLSTFQTLGGLGLLLGTVGLATVLLRNVLERRRELALLGAVGYERRHFLVMVVAENAMLLALGLVTGAVCAGLAIAPAIAERGGRLPLTSGGALLLFAVFVAGLLSSVVATRAATRAPLLTALRSE
jgi:putative ABC transport system permease protein